MSASFNIGRIGDYFRISWGGLEGGEIGKLYHYLRSYPAGVSQLELEDVYGLEIVWVGGGGCDAPDYERAHLRNGELGAIGCGRRSGLEGRGRVGE